MDKHPISGLGGCNAPQMTQDRLYLYLYPQEPSRAEVDPNSYMLLNAKKIWLMFSNSLMQYEVNLFIFTSGYQILSTC